MHQRTVPRLSPRSAAAALAIAAVAVTGSVAAAVGGGPGALQGASSVTAVAVTDAAGAITVVQESAGPGGTRHLSVPGVVEADVLSAGSTGDSAGVRLGAVTVGGRRLLDTASVTCGPTGVATTLGATAGVGLPAQPAPGMTVELPGTGTTVLGQRSTPSSGGVGVTGVRVQVPADAATGRGAQTVDLGRLTCPAPAAVVPSGTGVGGAAASPRPAGQLSVSLVIPAGVPGAPASTPARPGSSAPASAPGTAPGSAPGSAPAAPAVPRVTFPARPGEAPAPSAVPAPDDGSGAFTG